MRVFEVVVGVLSLALGALLCFPAAIIAWLTVSSRFGGPSFSPGFALSIESLTVTGWQMWLLVGGLTLFGVFVAIVGFDVLSSNADGR